VSATASSQALWSGKAMRDAFAFAATWLQHHRDRVNALNVFPVPDGDTGTNMALTMTGALEALDGLPADATAAEIAQKLANGALMGARGNSGVILSQIFRGFANGIGAATQIDGHDLARALDGARETAYKAVMRPVEGTMLTVIRGAADAASAASETQPSIVDVLRAALAGAQHALDHTPEQLDILRQAGVVDAGGQGVVYILEALLKSATGDTALPTVTEPAAVGGDMAFLDRIEELHGEDAFGYCTNFMVFGEGMDPERERERIAAMGQSAVIVGDDSMLKVHIHTLNPGEVLAHALTLGDLDQIKIDNMSTQTEALSGQRRAAAGTAPVPESELVHGDLGIIAVAAGAGISAALRSLGVTRIVEGGQTMNPSTQELLAAVEESPASEIILLPNNKNILMAASQVPDLTGKEVRVVPTRSIPAALAALSAFNTDQSLYENVAVMTEAMAETTAVAVTRAVRDVELNGVTVATGQAIGLINDDLATAGDDDLEVALRTLETAGVDDPELLTVFVGDRVADTDAKRLETALAEAWPDAEIEMHNGGQPHYRYIISAE
jgi:DAK2 domain fusion protein YloV